MKNKTVDATAITSSKDGDKMLSSTSLLSSKKNKTFVAPVPGASSTSLTLILMVLTMLSVACAASLLWLMEEHEKHHQAADDENEATATSSPPPSSLITEWLQPYDRWLFHSTLQCYSFAVFTTLAWILVITHLQLELRMTETHMPMLRSYLFFLGQAPRLVFYRPWDLFRMWHDAYGSVYTFPLFGQLFVSISDPYVLKLVLQSKIQHVRKDVVTAYKPFMDILGTGIVTSEDAAWMQQRAKMSHPLRVDILQKIPNITLAALERMFQDFERACETDTPLDLAEALRRLTLQVISEAFLSLTADESDRTFAKMYLPIVDEANQRIWHPYRAYLPLLPSYWNHVRHVRALNKYVSHLIQKRWEQRRNQQQAASTSTTVLRDVDVLDQVLHHYEVGCQSAIPHMLSVTVVNQLRDEMKTFMLAGHETSAAMMTWTAIELMLKPKLLEQVVQEAKTVFGSADKVVPKQAPPLEDLSHLVFTEACLKESLRKYSVTPTLTRRVVKDLDIHELGFHIPKGTTLILNVLTVHHNESYWPNPMEYNPWRFLPTTNEEPPPVIQPFTYLPFIAGPRNCLGQYLSLLESKIVISMIMSRYQLTLATDPTDPTCLQNFDTNCWDTEEQDPRHRFMVPVVPKGKVMVNLTKRN